MKILKRIGLVLLALITLLALWIAINSIDDRELSAEAREMLKPFPEVPPEENGYNDVAYLNTNPEGFKKETGLDTQLIQDLYRGKTSEGLDTLINHPGCNKIVDSIRASVSKKHFKTPDTHLYTDKLIRYQGFINAWKLLALKSRFDANQGEYENAIHDIELLHLSSRHMQMDGNHYLISYFIAIVGESFALNAIHELLSNHDLKSHHYERISNLLSTFPAYKNDGFRESVYGAIKLNIREAMRYHSMDMPSRITARNEYASLWKDDQKLRNRPADNSVFEAYEMARAIFPWYYIHKNTILNHELAFIEDVEKNLNQPCSDFLEYIPGNNIYYRDGIGYPVTSDIFTPNSYMRIIANNTPRWSNYFDRRCLHHSYISAIKAATAIQWYKSEHGRPPDTLAELVPQYMEQLPTDFLDGNPIRYSKDKQWVYSVGSNYIDNGGSISGMYRGGCHGAYRKDTDESQKICRTNPTVPINWNDYPAELR